MKSRWMPENYQLKTLNILLAAHGVILKGLLALAILAALFPVVVVCDDGNILNCVGAGIVFFGAVAGSSLATVGLAIVALRKPSRCLVPCDHIPRRSWPLFRAKAMLDELIADLKPRSSSHSKIVSEPSRA